MPDSTFNLRSFSSTPKTTILVYVSTHISFYISQIFFIDQVSRFFSLFFSSEVNLPKISRTDHSFAPAGICPHAS
jgi:ABC-type phosphonate transport system ATPase subunit